MADLSTLDAAQPVGSDPVAQADDKIRETRDAVKTSFGGSDLGTGTQASEHFLKGFHKFPNGTAAARPAAGNAARIYLNTESTRIERDTGAAWAMLNAVGLTRSASSAVSSLNTSYSTMGTLTVDIPPGGRLIVAALISILANTTFTLKFTQGGTLIDAEKVFADRPTGTTDTLTFFLTEASPNTGSVTVLLQGKCTSSLAPYSGVHMVALVI